MDRLIIKQEKNGYTAFLNDVEIPFISKINITSLPSQLTKISIEIVVIKTGNAEVIIEGIEFKNDL